jgi:hypothetical protein
MKTILSLFDHSGNWSRPYRENGYNVIQIDLKLGTDILTWDYTQIKNVVGVLAAPECTHFAGSGAQYWKEKDADGRTAEALKLVDKMLEIIDYFQPVFSAWENPVGRLQKLRPQMGAPWYFQPFWYGDPYTKKTGLWGKFNKPEKTNEVEPVRQSPQGSWIQKLGGKSSFRKELRSKTPIGFAYAFYEANHP